MNYEDSDFHAPEIESLVAKHSMPTYFKQLKVGRQVTACLE